MQDPVDSTEQGTERTSATSRSSGVEKRESSNGDASKSSRPKKATDVSIGDGVLFPTDGLREVSGESKSSWKSHK